MMPAAAKFHPELLRSLGVTISRLVTDSRAVQTGDTFVAYPGFQADGRHYIAQAIAKGANAVLWEAQEFKWDDAWRVPNLAVRDLRHHAGEIADQVYGNPSGKLWMGGITGTNGKTSCSHWLAQALSELGRKSAVIGTLGNGFPGALEPSPNTAPDAVQLHGLLAEYLEQNAQAVAMEVSSHALDQGRVNGVQYDVALLTNLSHDHLDYHGDMQNYAAAKRRLFDWRQLKFAVLNLDDAFGRGLAEELQSSQLEVIGYGLGSAAKNKAEKLGIRMVSGSGLHMDTAGLHLHVQTSWGESALASKLIGRFNVSNLLGVLAVLLASDMKLPDVVRVLQQIKSVPGRMQRLGGGDRPTVVVDYAHTPDALEKVLQTMREVVAASGGRLISVFGCGGDRDRGKRPMMGKVAAKLSDLCIVTSDNPRSEDPLEIIVSIVSGMVEENYQIIEERAEAITEAIRMANAADAVLLAGKGHETTQEIMGVKQPFSDVEVAQRALDSWGAQA